MAQGCGASSSVSLPWTRASDSFGSAQVMTTAATLSSIEVPRREIWTVGSSTPSDTDAAEAVRNTEVIMVNVCVV